MERRINSGVKRVCDETCLELGKDTVPQQTVTNSLQRIVSKPIAYKNAFPPRKQALLLQRQLKCVEDIIVTRYMANLGVTRREVIQTISDIGQASSFVQDVNHLDYLIWYNCLPNMERHGRVIKYQATTT